MKYWTLIGCLFLSGCSEFNRWFGIGGGPANYADVLFVGAGQSNMENQNLSQTFPASINIAKSGSYITQWKKGTPFYNELVKACSSPKPVVLLWWQGEAEGYGQILADEWSMNFVQIVANLRQDIGYKLPVIYVQIGHFNLPADRGGNNIEGSTWQSVSSQQAALNGRDGLSMVSIKDLDPGPDGLHYTQDAYKIIQKRMLQVYLGV